MNTIYKYPLEPIPGMQTVLLPAAAHILCIKEQEGKPVLYALVDPDNAETSVGIFSVTTGSPCFLRAKTYINTVMFDGGQYVLHFFKSE